MTSARPLATEMNIERIAGIIEATSHAKPSVTPGNLKAAVIKTKVFYLPDDTNLQTRSIVLSTMTLFGRSKDGDVRRWKTWLLSYLCMCYPELVEIAFRRNPREYTLEPIDPMYVTNWQESFDQVDESEEEDVTAEALAHPLFPEIDGILVDAELVGCNELDGLYCYASLLLFLAGKSITQLNRNAITTKRPKALMDEFQTHGSAYILTGKGRIGDNGHQLVHAAWTASVDPRIEIVEHFAQAMGVSATPYRIISHTMRLMRLNGMNYVVLILRFMEAFKEHLKDIPQLRSDIRAYQDSAARWVSIDDSIRPFYKFAYGNECTIFRRRDMSGLVACGIVYGSSTSETLKNYRIDAGYSALINQVAKIASLHGILFARSADQAVVTHAL